MSLEQALLAQARGPLMAAKARALVRDEAIKGCEPFIAPHPVALEPPFRPIGCAEAQTDPDSGNRWVTQTPVPAEELVRLQVWISPEQSCDWSRSELFLKQLYPVRHRVGLELAGNRLRIEILLLCHRDDLPVIQTAFYGMFERCELTTGDDLEPLLQAAWNGDDVSFWDFVPPPPYSHLLTRPDELRLSPYGSITTALASIEPPAVGLYQALWQPVAPDHDWHHNVQRLVDLEFAIKLMAGCQPPQRYAQQLPSGDLRHMAMDTEFKAHNDKPFFSAAARIGVIGAGDQAQRLLVALSTFSSLIQHGGRPLDHLTDEDYRSHLPSEAMRRMLVEGHTYRPGFLLNSWELTSLAHIPTANLTEHRAVRIETLETLPSNPSLSEGTPIGTCHYAGRDQPVCIPDVIRSEHVHFIGRTGQGKSTLLEHMTLFDIEQGRGVAVLDPHGALVERLLRLIDARHSDRVIYLNPGLPGQVPIWNPLRCPPGQEPGRVADDIGSAFRSFMTGWGDRLEHLLRQALLGVLHLPGGNLLDVSDLLRKGSRESELLKRQVLQVVDYEVSQHFWRTDFRKYGPADLTPPQHKLSKLLSAGSASRMLSQSDSAFDLREVMDSGQILLVDLSRLGPDLRQILGCFMLSLLYLTAISRSDMLNAPYRPFHIYCDEAHRFLTDAVEDVIAETRKFGVSLALAHQYMKQFREKKVDALSNVGSTIIFNVDSKNADYLKKDLQGRVSVDDVIKLEPGQAIARIGTEIVRLRTPKPMLVPEPNSREQIIQRSLEKYYRPTAEVKQAIRRRHERWTGAFSPLSGEIETVVAGEGERIESTDSGEFDYECL